MNTFVTPSTAQPSLASALKRSRETVEVHVGNNKSLLLDSITAQGVSVEVYQHACHRVPKT